MSEPTSQSILEDMTLTTSSTLTIRPAYADDQRALRRLAELDSAEQPPALPLLVAEVDGELRAALSLANGEAIANPFFRTATTLELLRLHASSVALTRRNPVRDRVSAWHRARQVAPRIEGAPVRSS
jgi:hypothetical protein